MDNSNSEDLCGVEPNGEGRIDDPASTSSSYKLFGRQATVHQMVGGGKAADVILWRRRRVSFGIVVVATFSWLLIERSGISFLSLCSDVLLILVVLLFLQANYAVFRNKQLQTLPELVLSEEMVTNAAASFRVKVNYMLLMAHDITLGKDFRLFFKTLATLPLNSLLITMKRELFAAFDLKYEITRNGKNIQASVLLGMNGRAVLTTQVVIALWLLSVIGSLISFATLAYIGIIISITIPALYDKFEDRVDHCVGMIHRQFSKHYKIVDESLHSRLPRTLTKDKDP